MSHENNETPEVKDHEFDGIKEFDNPLPMWWLWTFFITIIFAVIYYIHYEFAGGPNQVQELSDALKTIQMKKTTSTLPAEIVTEDSLKKLFEKSEALTLGAQLYTDKCAVCHGTQLQGQIGPNLTDEYWIHGRGTRLDLYEVIRTGIPDKGMPPWESLLKPSELANVSAFVFSKKGSHPPNPKSSQGDLVNDLAK